MSAFNSIARANMSFIFQPPESEPLRTRVRRFICDVHGNVEVQVKVWIWISRGGGASAAVLDSGSRGICEETVCASCRPLTAKALPDFLPLHFLCFGVRPTGG